MGPEAETDLAALPLDSWHRARGGRMVPFAGYAMPVQFQGIVAEHEWTRNHASLFDVSHMGQLFVSGDGAEAALEALLPIDLATLELGALRYSLLLDDEGGILDDLIVARWRQGFLVVVNGATKHADIAHLRDRLPAGVALEHLALRILDWLGLGEVEWRVRPDRAEEIDGTAQGAMPAFARWQVQAKNTARLTADDAAKEVGLAVVNGASVVMLITTGSLTAPARSIVERAERRGGLSMLCVEGSDVRRIAADPGCLTEIVARESLRTRSLRAA